MLQLLPICCALFELRTSPEDCSDCLCTKSWFKSSSAPYQPSSLRSTRISALYTRSIHSYTRSTTPTRVPVAKTVFLHTHCTSNSSHNTLHIIIRLVISSLSIPHVCRYVKLLSNTALSATGSGELWFLGWEREGVVHEAGTMGYCLWQVEEADSGRLEGYYSCRDCTDRYLGQNVRSARLTRTLQEKELA